MSSARPEAIATLNSGRPATTSTEQQRLLSTYLPFASHGRGSSSPAVNSSSTSSSSSAPSKIAPKLKATKQTRLDQHLRTVKPGSPSPSASSHLNKSASCSRPVMAPARSTRSGRNSLKLQEPIADAQEEESTTSSVQAPAAPITSAERKGKAVVKPSEASAGAAPKGSKLVKPTPAPLSKEKLSLLKQLASHGITPSDQVLDDTLAVLDSEKQDWTVELFLSALARSGDPPPSPAVRPVTLEKLQVDLPPPPKSFSTLESPSTPSESLRPAFDFSSSPRSSKTDVEPLLRTPPRLLPPLEPLPVTPRTQRLAAFSSVSTPLPVPASARPTTRQTRNRLAPPPPPPAATGMVAAQVEGMGRVALSRSVLFSQLGSATAEQAIAAAALGPATPPLVFGALSAPESSSATSGKAFDAFGAAISVPALQLKPRRGGGKIGSHLVDERLGRVRNWLESDGEDEEEAEETRGLTWSRAPKEWETDLAEEERQRLIEQKLEPEVEIEYVDLEEEEEEVEPVMHQQVRVGGKNIRVLLHTKRKRVQEDGGLAGSEQGDATSTVVEEEEELEKEEEIVQQVVKAPKPIAPLRTPPKTRATLAMQLDRDESARPNGKGRAVEDTIDCVCSTPDDEDQPMIQCDDCRVWLHLACLNIPSSKRLPKEWSCFRCTDTAPPEPRSAKRVRILEGADEGEEEVIESPTTPTFSPQEPTLVASSTSPRARNTFSRGFAADMALAPSPQSSPIRRHATVPRSPVANHLVSIPVTPKLSTDARADYSPRSPLFYRRTRMVSGGGGDEIQGGWVGSWDGHVFGTSHDYQEHYPMESEDDFQPKSWHDMTMTPSRTVASAFEWETPGARARGAPPTTTATPRTASQSFLSGLHAESDPQHEGGGHARAPSYAQRLFGSPTHHHRVPSSTSAPYLHSPSPHKGPRATRQRVPSVPFGLQPSFNASSTSALASSNPFTVGMARRGSLEYGATASPFRTAMARTASGSLEHAVGLDDLLAL